MDLYAVLLAVRVAKILLPLFGHLIYRIDIELLRFSLVIYLKSLPSNSATSAQVFLNLSEYTMISSVML